MERPRDKLCVTEQSNKEVSKMPAGERTPSIFFEDEKTGGCRLGMLSLSAIAPWDLEVHCLQEAFAKGGVQPVAAEPEAQEQS